MCGSFVSFCRMLFSPRGRPGRHTGPLNCLIVLEENSWWGYGVSHFLWPLREMLDASVWFSYRSRSVAMTSIERQKTLRITRRIHTH
eukprot:5548044-Amphidinium_carterae.1